MLPFRFGVLDAVPPTTSVWRNQARTAEGLGYSTLYVSDHLDAEAMEPIAPAIARLAGT
jgi:alkanesulfonate monooxygenase SsuD/methylene tetrahydromethanopterin reductase-like flavin-dependent oxidoreductase (luciferase family)